MSGPTSHVGADVGADVVAVGADVGADAAVGAGVGVDVVAVGDTVGAGADFVVAADVGADNMSLEPMLLLAEPMLLLELMSEPTDSHRVRLERGRGQRANVVL